MARFLGTPSKVKSDKELVKSPGCFDVDSLTPGRVHQDERVEVSVPFDANLVGLLLRRTLLVAFTKYFALTLTKPFYPTGLRGKEGVAPFLIHLFLVIDFFSPGRVSKMSALGRFQEPSKDVQNITCTKTYHIDADFCAADFDTSSTSAIAWAFLTLWRMRISVEDTRRLP